MKIEVIKFKNKQLNSSEWIEEEVTRFGHKIIYRKNLYKKWHNLCKNNWQ